MGMGTLGKPVAVLCLSFHLWVRWLQHLCLELPSTMETGFLKTRSVFWKGGYLVQQEAGLAWTLLGLLGSGEMLDHALCHLPLQACPPREGSILCFSGPFSTTAKMGQDPCSLEASLSFLNAESQQDGLWVLSLKPLGPESVEAKGMQMCSWMPGVSSLSQQGQNGQKGRQLPTSTDQCARWRPKPWFAQVERVVLQRG